MCRSSQFSLTLKNWIADSKRNAMVLPVRMALLAAVLLWAPCADSFTGRRPVLHRNNGHLHQRNMVVDSSGVVSLLAGGLAGSIGVGVAYPLDSLKTKAQVAAAKRGAADGQALGMVGIARYVLEEEGVQGFYGGVVGVMVGQAFIKALAFSSNNAALGWLLHGSTGSPPLETLVLAAAFSGFITSFLVNPIERVKILMQADDRGEYADEWDCASRVVRRDGFSGLAFRGLGATLAREVPGYGLYFVAYSLLTQSPLVEQVVGPAAAPLLCGAAAGCISWIPVYPADVVKTAQQNTQGGGPANAAFEIASAETAAAAAASGAAAPAPARGFLATAAALYAQGGVGIFFDGLSPKMLRAAVNHAVTFTVYDVLVRAAAGTP